ncbi:hypothetical protein LG329_11740 [Virgibacillus necropolis]|uniref:hypothetical protein n=1 Tax=Virgibacillus necropolis TaxID=163877 RepID=UPI00384F84C8
MKAKLDAILESLEDLKHGQKQFEEKLELLNEKLIDFGLRLDNFETKLDYIDEEFDNYMVETRSRFKYTFANMDEHKALFEMIESQNHTYRH